MPRRLSALFSLLLAAGLLLGTAPAYAVLRDDETPPPPPPPPPTFSVLSAGATKAAPAAAASGPAVYIVELTAAPVAGYAGGLPNLVGTSAATTGAGKLDAASPATQAYVRHLDAAQAEVLDELERASGAEVEAIHSYRYALSGFAARLTPAQAATLATLPGVRRVTRDEVYHPDSDAGPAFIGAAQPDLKPAIFQAGLTTAQETTPPTGTTANTKGTAVASYDAATKSITFRVSYQGLTGAATAAHIHIGAAGAAGGVVLDIFDTAVGTPAASGAFVGSKTIVDVAGGVNKTAAEIEAALYAGGLYFNVHTAANPGGEIRGQVTAARGEGVIIGVLDSGINITNPSFADVGGDGYNHTNPLGKKLGVCDPANERYIATFPCNDKVIGAYTFSENTAIADPQGGPSPYDDDGHGSHTASTAGGNVVTSSSVNGVSTGAISGVAPHANLIIYDVCGITSDGSPSDGCPTSALVAAVDQATADGVDVYNRSISSGGNDPWASADALAALAAFGAGVVPVGSAGNSGPDVSTLVGAVHSAPWTISVAASTHDRIFINSLGGFAGGSAGSRPGSAIDGKGLSGSLALTSIVYAGDAAIGNAQCLSITPTQAAKMVGKIVVCDRGTGGRVEKADNVKAAGAVGYVLANNQANGDSLVGDVFPLPGLHISYDDGVALKAWLTGCTTCQATISGAIADRDPAYGDIMASFSSRGPSGDGTGSANPIVGGVLKPDVAAPGVDILAVGVNASAAAADYTFLSGTSMAAPHAAGAVALIRQVHPDWTPAEVKSALVTTGVTSMLKEDGTTAADAFDRGGGRVELARAIFAGLVFDSTAADMLAVDPFFGGKPETLNLPSMASGSCIARCTFVREVRSTLNVPVEWSAAGTGGGGLSVTVQPSSFTIAPGATQTLTITADVTAATLDQYYFGGVTLTPADGVASTASLPLAVKPAASDLPSQITITTPTLTGSVTRQVTSIAASDLITQTYGLVRTTPTALSLPEDPTPGDLFDSATGVTIRPVNVPAGTTRYHVRTGNSRSPDLDLYVYLDGLDTADGVPQEAELVCTSATSSNEEWCDFTLPNGAPLPAPAPLLVVVQNYQGSGAATDGFNLYSGTVGSTAAGNLRVSAPDTNSAGGTFALGLSYDVTGAKEGDVYVGLVRLGTAPASAGNLGYTLVDVIYDQYSVFLPLISKK